jgi:hypothetical protein
MIAYFDLDSTSSLHIGFVFTKCPILYIFIILFESMFKFILPILTHSTSLRAGFGFVLHNLLKISYVFFRRMNFQHKSEILNKLEIQMSECSKRVFWRVSADTRSPTKTFEDKLCGSPLSLRRKRYASVI